MQSVLAKKNKGAIYRTLKAREKAQAAMESLRGQRSVVEIASHWQVNPDELLQWQHTLVDRAASLFGEDASAAGVQLAHIQQANEALIHQVFVQMDAKENLQESSNALHRLIAHQDQRKEQERKRLALEIHDELGQNLLAVRIDISMLQERTRVRHPRLHRRVGMVLANIDSAIKASRSMINELRPFELELGLPAVAKWQLNRFARMTGIAVQLEIGGFDEDSASLSDELTLTLFRVLQESLDNVAQRAGANHVGVTLRRNEAGVELVVQDDGKGARRGAVRAEDNLVLAAMCERVNALGGELSMDHPRGGGTRLHSWVPVPHDEPA
jgi:signal transduction histidine kinase